MVKNLIKQLNTHIYIYIYILMLVHTKGRCIIMGYYYYYDMKMYTTNADYKD